MIRMTYGKMINMIDELFEDDNVSFVFAYADDDGISMESFSTPERLVELLQEEENLETEVGTLSVLEDQEITGMFKGETLTDLYKQCIKYQKISVPLPNDGYGVVCDMEQSKARLVPFDGIDHRTHSELYVSDGYGGLGANPKRFESLESALEVIECLELTPEYDKDLCKNITAERRYAYLFKDTSSGGTQKTDYKRIIIECSSNDDPKEIFKQQMDIDPDHTTCDCCGPDFSVFRYDDLESFLSDSLHWGDMEKHDNLMVVTADRKKISYPSFYANISKYADLNNLEDMVNKGLSSIHEAPPQQEPLLLGDFRDLNYEKLERVISSQYEVSEKEIKRFDILVAFQWEGDYGCDSESFLLLKDRETGDLYENYGSHCSCDGFEGQFEPEKTSLEYLTSEKFNPVCSMHKEEEEEIKEFTAKLAQQTLKNIKGRKVETDFGDSLNSPSL